MNKDFEIVKVNYVNADYNYGPKIYIKLYNQKLKKEDIHFCEEFNNQMRKYEINNLNDKDMYEMYNSIWEYFDKGNCEDLNYINDTFKNKDFILDILKELVFYNDYYGGGRLIIEED